MNLPVESFEIRRLSAAMTNTVYIISKNEASLYSEPRKVLLRVYGEGIESILNRSDEISWFLKLSKARAGPLLLATFQNGRIEEYIESVTLTPNMMRRQDVSRGIAKSMANFHTLPIDQDEQEFVLWRRLESWRSEAKASLMSLLPKSSAEQLEVLKKIKSFGVLSESKELAEFYEFLCSFRSPVVPCHNDLQHGNILLTESGKIVLIDYEYGGMNFAAFDIANHFCEWASDFTENNPTPHLMEFEGKYPKSEETLGLSML